MPGPILVRPNLSRCPHVANVTPAARKDDKCNLIEMETLEAVERTLRKKFQSGWSPHKLVIDWGCNAPAEEIRDIDFEDGSGHGGSLRLFHLERNPTSGWELRAIAFSGYYNTGTFYAVTHVDGKKLDAALGSLRVAMLAKMHDVATYRENGAIGLGSFSTSSNDFHLRIRLADADGKSLDRTFSGYQSTNGQEDRLPMELAAEPIQATLKNVNFAAGVPTQADRELFVRHFIATFEKEPFWWVGERMFEMAPTLGTAEIVPSIVQWLAHHHTKPDRIEKEAVDALAAITGLDLRKTPSGEDRPLEEVIADYVRECG